MRGEAPEALYCWFNRPFLIEARCFETSVVIYLAADQGILHLCGVAVLLPQSFSGQIQVKCKEIETSRQLCVGLAQRLGDQRIAQNDFFVIPNLRPKEKLSD